MQLDAVRDFVREMAWAGGELVGFRALLDRARSAVGGAVGDFGACDGFAQVAQGAGGVARVGVVSTTGDEAAHEIVGDYVEEPFALDRGGAFGAQVIHLQDGLAGVEKVGGAACTGASQSRGELF